MPYKDIEKQRAARRKYEEENKERRLAAKNTKRSMMRRLIQESKEVPCADCDIQYPYYIMQFDHLPGSVKVGTIANCRNFASLDALREEIDKCEVVCANCHAHRTFMRLGSIA